MAKIVRVVSVEPFVNSTDALLTYQIIDVPRPSWMTAGVSPPELWRIVNTSGDWQMLLLEDLEADDITRGIKL